MTDIDNFDYITDALLNIQTLRVKVLSKIVAR